MTSRIPLVDLALRDSELTETMTVIRSVLERGWFVLGPEVRAFEEAMAASVRRRFAVGVGSGTDALTLILRGLEIGAGDEVIVPGMTAFATAAAVLDAGATPVLADVTPSVPLLDLHAALACITGRTKAVILVHLYGVCADADAFAAALSERGVILVEDCAQAQGATLPSGRPVGTAGAASAFSFYPTKNLAGLGDGGAVVCDDEELAREVEAWRSHGERGRRYWHERPARNSRLDDIQAAVLRLRLDSLRDRIARRCELSAAYDRLMPRSAGYVAHGSSGAPHLAVVAVDDRTGLARHLDGAGIATGVHYPFALSEQPALAHHAAHADTPHARAWSRRCLSLPLHEHMTDRDAERVAAAVSEWMTSQ